VFQKKGLCVGVKVGVSNNAYWFLLEDGYLSEICL
jgi:hypothetical protein